MSLSEYYYDGHTGQEHHHQQQFRQPLASGGGVKVGGGGGVEGPPHSAALDDERNELLQAFFSYREKPAAPTTTSSSTTSRVEGAASAGSRSRLYGGGSSVPREAAAPPAAEEVEGPHTGSTNERWQAFFHYKNQSAAAAAGGDDSDVDSPWMEDGQLLRHHQHQHHHRQGATAAGGGGDGYDQDEFGDDPESEFYYREERWRERVELERETLRQDLQEERAKECTFKPAINKTKPRRPLSSAAAAALPAGHQEQDVGSRLYNLHLNTLVKQSQAKKEQEERKVKSLTFQPALVKAGWTTEVTPRYLEPTTRGQSGSEYIPSTEVSKMLEKERQECTFTPVTNKKVPPFVSRYLEVPAHERLNTTRHGTPTSSRQRNTTTTSGANSSRGAIGRGGGGGGSPNRFPHTARTFSPQHGGNDSGGGHDDSTAPGLDSFYDVHTPRRGGNRSTGATRRLTSEQQQAFVNRMTESHHRQEATKARLKAETDNTTPFKPKISLKSRQLAVQAASKRSQSAQGGGGGDCQQRRNPQHFSHEHCMDGADDEFTFTPKIDKKSRSLSSQWLKHKGEVEQRRQQRMERYRSEKEMAEVSGMTFQPEISEAASHSTQAQIKRAVQSDSNFKTFLSMQQVRREKHLKSHRRELIERDQVCCTFEPEVHDAPPYVKDIAYQMSLARTTAPAAEAGVPGGGGGERPYSRSRSQSSTNSPPRALNFSTEVSRPVRHKF